MATPYYTSSDIIESVKRKITIPTSQYTFEDGDILKFANEELLLDQVASVLEYHEEYFVTKLLEGGATTIPLVANKSKYSIPGRAIGLKLRNIFYMDTSGNLRDLSRISPDNQAFFQASLDNSSSVDRFYLEGNDVVLLPSIGVSPVGSLVFSYFLRPNILVANDQAAIVTGFSKTITIDNTTLVAGNTLTINGVVFTAVASSPGANEFEIGGTSAITAANLTSSINTNGAAVTTVNSTIVTCVFLQRSIVITTTNTVALVVQVTLGLVCSSVPSNIVTGSPVDLLQTKSGHRTRGLSLPVLNASATTLTFTDALVSDEMIVGDYICYENECIIPQIPTDLHINLIEKTCARILSAIGDYNGEKAVNEKIQKNDQRQGTLIDNRTEGNPQKVFNKNSLIRNGRTYFFRR